MKRNLEIMRCSKAKCWCPFSCKYLITMRKKGRKGKRKGGEREGGRQEREVEEEGRKKGKKIKMPMRCHSCNSVEKGQAGFKVTDSLMILILDYNVKL